MTEDTEQRHWVCMGLRVHQGKSVVYWLDGDQTRIFTERNKYVTGGSYDVKVSVTADKGVTRHGDPKYTGQRMRYDEPDLREWIAQERAAEARLRIASITRKHAAESRTTLDELLNPLAEIAAKLRTQADRDAFTAHVINRLRGW